MTSLQLPAGLSAGMAWAPSTVAFGVDMFKARAAATDKTVLISPHVLGKVTGMVASGANGDTQAQTAALLLDPFGTNSKGVGVYEASLSESSDAYEISTATSAYVNEGFPVSNKFLDDLTKKFGATAYPNRKFSVDADNERKLINKDVETATRGMVPNLFPEGTITSDTVLVLTAALYAKFGWAVKFDETLTESGAFTMMGGKTTPAALMHRNFFDPKTDSEYKTTYYETKTEQVLELPFAGGKFSAIVVLPKAEKNYDAALAELEKNLSEQWIEDWIGGLKQSKSEGGSAVNITLPRLNLEDGGKRNDFFKALGMTDAFTPGAADFTGISEQIEKGRLYVQSIVDGNKLTLDENGVVVAAAAGASIDAESLGPKPVNFVADRPFLLLIRDTESGVMLMMGRVADPGKADLTIKNGQDAATDPVVTLAWEAHTEQLLSLFDSPDFKWLEGIPSHEQNRYLKESLKTAFAMDFLNFAKKTGVPENQRAKIFGSALHLIHRWRTFGETQWTMDASGKRNALFWQCCLEELPQIRALSPLHDILGVYLENLVSRFQKIEGRRYGWASELAPDSHENLE